MLEIGGSQAADAVVPQYLADQAEVVSEAVLLLAVDGMDSVVVVEVIQATAQMDLPSSGEMRASPTGLVEGSVEANQSAGMVGMVGDSETASFASRMDWFALERRFAE